MILQLQKPLEKAIKSGHPWIFRNALKPFDTKPGSIVTVMDRSGNFLCRGLSDDGTIGVRVYLTSDTPLDKEFFRLRIVAALAHRSALKLQHTNTLRLIHGEGDKFPGLILDQYDTYAVMLFDGQSLYPWQDVLCEILAEELPKRGVDTLLFRTKKKHEKSVIPLWGQLPSQKTTVLEHAMKLSVDLIHGQKTGLFLDHRDSRLAVRSLSLNKRVLNLYGYTGGFSISAGLGGASHVTTVDSAKEAIAIAQADWVANGLPECNHTGVTADVPEFMKNYKGPQFDLIIADPPSFAPKKQAVEGALKAYTMLHASVLKTIQPGGIYIAASCSSHIRREMFEATLQDAARKCGTFITIAKVWGAGKDHPTLKGFVEGQYLKVFEVRVRK